MNGYCPVRRASSVCDSVFFSSLSLLFSAFLSIPPKLSNHGFESAWGPSHFIVFFFLSKHVQHPVYPIAALAALSPRSASEVSPDNR